VAFNIDADPINRNWLRWKTWSVGCEDLPELFRLLGIENAPRELQIQQLMRLNSFYVNAPELLNYQLREFLSGVELDAVTKKLGS